jgi:putative heme-binding domain-containing protein
VTRIRPELAMLPAAMLFAVSTAPLRAAPTGAQSLPAAVQAQVDAGSQLFATTCASCHGSAGSGALGPALAGRNIPMETLRNTILNGRMGTPMPPFQDDLDVKSQAEVIAYVEWLTSKGRLPNEIVSIEPPAGTSGSSADNSSQPIAIGRGTGTPARGAALFFDPTTLRSCSVCHSRGDKGGPIAPDLAGFGKTPLEIYQSITRPRVATPRFPAVEVRLRDGTRMLGIKSEESDVEFRLFDVSSLPPVERIVPKAEISSISAIDDSGIYDHTKLPFSRQELLDLSAYLGKTPGPSAGQ